MDEKFVKHFVMAEEFVKINVMDAKIDPKVVMDLCIWDGTGLQPINRKLLEEFIDENELWLLIRIPSKDSFLVIWYLERHPASSDQHVKESMPLREGLHERMQCDMRQHDACRHSTMWRESTRRKFMKGPTCRWNVQKMRSESSEDMRKTTGAFINNWRINNSLGELL